MAALSPTAFQPLSETYGSATAGQAAGYVSANGGGDTIPLLGQYLMLTFKTTGTASVITLDSVELSNFGTDVNVTVNMAATDEQDVLIKCDNRFKQTTGQVGSLALSYTSVVGLTVKAKYIS